VIAAVFTDGKTGKARRKSLPLSLPHGLLPRIGVTFLPLSAQGGMREGNSIRVRVMNGPRAISGTDTAGDAVRYNDWKVTQ
jgi:hypothetical protein